MAPVTRRQLLATTGAGALGVAVGGSGYALGRQESSGDGSGSVGGVIPFHGAHQAGIVTPAQDRLVFGAFDLTVDSAGELRELLRTWTQAAIAMTAGRSTGPIVGPRTSRPPTPARRRACQRRSSRSRLVSVRTCSCAGVRIALGWLRVAPPR